MLTITLRAVVGVRCDGTEVMSYRSLKPYRWCYGGATVAARGRKVAQRGGGGCGKRGCWVAAVGTLARVLVCGSFGVLVHNGM